MAVCTHGHKCRGSCSPLRSPVLDAWFGGDIATAQRIHHELLPVFTGTFRTQGAILTKAALNLMELPGGKVRLPLVDATPEQISQLREDLRAGLISI